MRKILVKILLTFLRWLGYSPHGLPESILKSAKIAIKEAERKAGNQSGQGKRAQALRMMMNLCPEASERDIGLAIEICLRQ